MKWLKALKAIVEIVIPVLGWLGKKKAEKKAKKLEKVTQVVIEGVEAYANTEDKKDIKAVIKNIAVATGVEDKLKEMVIRYTTPKPK